MGSKVGKEQQEQEELKNSYNHTNNQKYLAPTATATMSTLSVLTWNIWFDRHEWSHRMEFILAEINRLQPDFVCLQEVIPKFENLLLNSEAAKYYTISPFYNVHNSGYGVIMLAKKAYECQFNFVEFPTNMGRMLLIGSTIVAGRSLAVATAHFESLDNHPLRQEQLKIAARSLANYDTAILTGDFNFCSYRNYKADTLPLDNDCLQQIVPDYVDLWPALKGNDPNNTDRTSKGYTFDSTVNKNITQIEVARYDRVIARSSSGWQPTSIEIVGSEPIILNRVWPSDHFGLLAKFINSNIKIAEAPSSSISSLSSTISSFLNGCSLKGIKLLAIDFDATIVQVHTYGRWAGSVEALASHVRPIFQELFRQVASTSPPQVYLSIVTFSGQIDVIRAVIRQITNNPEFSQSLLIRGNDRSWQPPKSSSSTEGKQPHIASVLEAFRAKKLTIDQSEVILIDDDKNNIRVAERYGIKTLLFPIINLPGVHNKSLQEGLIEAGGVKVIRRIQLQHGAILCISAGSVVSFEGGWSGAIVNAANSVGLGGGGVDGAISDAGGSELLKARKALPVDAKGERIPVGQARITGPGTFGKLKVGYVIHAVGPNYHSYSSMEQADTLLRQAYLASMNLANEFKLEFVGFSLISSGIYRGNRSIQDVLKIALESIAEGSYEGLREVHLVAFTKQEITMLQDCADELLNTSGSILSKGIGFEEELNSFVENMQQLIVS